MKTNMKYPPWKLAVALLMTLLCLSSTSAFAAADITVTGQVLDSRNEPLIGVSVFVEGTTDGTATDLDGRFALKAKPDAVISFKYIGFRPVSIKASQLSGDSKVHLTEDATKLDDVVVIGYSTRKKETLTGAVTNINEKELLTTTHSSLAQSIEGKMPGLQIRQNSGEPGDFNTMINIRGFGTPLYVIDGIPQDLGGGVIFSDLTHRT